MSAVPLSETAAKRRIGDILLAHGFVTAEELADAVLEQERTQQPLGQILVGRGAITRLELASALAEQWSDPAASITSNTRSAAAAPVAPAPTAQDEAQYAARLQEAVADLARKVQSNKPLDGIDERVEELSRRIESTLARTQHIEAAVATLAESLEGVTTGVEEAFYALQTGTTDLVSDLARIEQTVAELAGRDGAQDNEATLAGLAELQGAVAALSDDAAGTRELKAHVAELAARLDETGTPRAAVEDMSRRLDHVVDQLDSLRSATNLDELATTVHDLESRSASFAGIGERLDRMESESIGEELRAEIEDHARLLDGIGTALAELRERPAGNPGADDRLSRLEAQLGEAAGARDELVARVDEIAGRLSEQTAADPRVDDVLPELTSLAARLDVTVSEVNQIQGAIARHDEAAVERRLADLTDALAGVREEIAGAAASTVHDERFEALEARIETLAEAREQGLALAARFDALEVRIADDQRVSDLGNQMSAIRAEVASLERLGDRTDEANRLTWLEARIETLSRSVTEDGLHATRLEELEQARAGDADTVNVLAVAMDRMRHDLTIAMQAEGPVPAEVLGAVEALGRRIEVLEEAPAEPAHDDSDVVAELERVRLVTERVSLHLAEHDRAIADLAPSRGVEERLQELTVLVHDLAESQQNAAAHQSPGGASSIPGDIGTLLQRVEEAETASQTDSEKLMNRLERMASAIDSRLERLESEAPSESQ